jgi:hypothetical protein
MGLDTRLRELDRQAGFGTTGGWDLRQAARCAQIVLGVVLLTYLILVIANADARAPIGLLLFFVGCIAFGALSAGLRGERREAL